MSRCCATRTSRREAFSGAAKRSVTDALALAVLLQQHPAEQHCPDGHRAVGDVEGPEAHAAHTDVDEVHDAARRANSIDEIAGRTTPRKTEREHFESLHRRAPAIQSP